MKIWYVFMFFPAPSEAFAGVEVRAVHAQDADVSVHALRWPHRDASRLVDDLGLQRIPIEHGSWDKVARGVLAGLTQLPVLCDLLCWIVRRTWNKPKELFKSLVLSPLIFNLFVAIQSQRPDVVHLFWGHYPALLGYLVNRHCPDVVLSVFLGAYDLRQGFPCSIDVARSADVVWTHTRYNIDDLEDYGIPRAHIRLNYRGIKINNTKMDSMEKVPLRIVTAGRLLKFKGMDNVLRVFHKVLQQRPEASLVILGDGPEMKPLCELAASLGIASAVSFRGQVSHDQVYAEMMQAEVFLFMSKIERLPNVVKEAMACRCLCIVTETPGIGELVRDTENGLITADDVGAAAKLVTEVFLHRNEYASMAEQGRRTVMEQFNVDRNVIKYLSTWQHLLQSKQACPVANISEPV